MNKLSLNAQLIIGFAVVFVAVTLLLVLLVFEGSEGGRLPVMAAAGAGVILLVSVGACFFILRGALRPLRKVTSRFNQGAAEITQTAGRLARSSQLLARGASDNTSAVLEAVSNLEELLGMARQNAGHSTRAKEMVAEVKNHVQEADDSITEISGAMDEIRESSQASSKVIRTVEEIAFQTNLLALNAAVEAARAGEAGAGFAVVAEEVRNLATRSAEAAKNTNDILAGSMNRINQGAELVRKAIDSFASMVSLSDQMAAIIGEIAQASQNQAQGIQNIHQSIARMDKVTQENAAGAGENQSLSQILSHQAALLSEALGEMKAVLSDSNPSPAAGRLRAAEDDQAFGRPESFNLAGHLDQGSGRIQSSVVDSGKKKVLDAAIPMDDDGF